MRKLIIFLIISASMVLVVGCQKNEIKFELENESVSLIVGEKVNVKINSYIDEPKFSILNKEYIMSNVEINNNALIIEGVSLGEESITIYEETSKEERQLKIKVVSELIYLDELFSKCSEDYLIYFYSNDCIACHDTTEYIYEFLEFNKNVKIYFCNLKQGTKENKLYRVYNGEDGEGTDKKSYISGTKLVSDIYIANIPALARVSASEIKFLADGKTNVKNILNN